MTQLKKLMNGGHTALADGYREAYWSLKDQVEKAQETLAELELAQAALLDDMGRWEIPIPKRRTVIERGVIDTLDTPAVVSAAPKKTHWTSDPAKKEAANKKRIATLNRNKRKAAKEAKQAAA